MKKSLSLITLLIGASVFAETSVSTAAGGNTFGALWVASSAEQTIVAVPWLATAATESPIQVTDLVKTANLKAGDELYYYDSAAKSYKAWRLKADKTWEAANLVMGSGTTLAGANETLQRGNAILLKRSNPATGFYLYGQVASTAMQTLTLAQGSESAPAYSLIAPPAVAETDLNSGATWENVNTGDYIVLADLTTLNWNGTAWGLKERNLETKVITYDTTRAKIPAGQGAWYISCGGAAAAATVTWANLPFVAP